VGNIELRNFIINKDEGKVFGGKFGLCVNVVDIIYDMAPFYDEASLYCG